MQRPSADTPPTTDTATAGALLSRYLCDQAAEFLRALRASPEGGEEAARDLRRPARRISSTLHTFRTFLDAAWADQLRTELAWLSGTLAREHAYTARLARLLEALGRLSDASAEPALSSIGAARAGALLERQLTLARTRAHSAALQALGSSRFHAVADAVALLASEVPLAPAADAHAAEVLPCAAESTEARLTEAVALLPLGKAALPYNAEGLSDAQDAPWHTVRLLLRLHRYAHEVLYADLGPEDQPGPDSRVFGAGQALDRHREASEAAAAAASAARTPRIAPATAYALGVLHADQRHEVEAARYAFQQTWQRAAVSAP
ncbi:CHAD domain-containing protein [Streptomyces sp. NBC_01465]|uniref:CHAD domain-containing protein n=1 Tax=Streptomyces sp. NBC_01465 TaxID=2903878 RepID=UPI002E366042|nr:CHAD domain-containing protein [Streptomyces sp. NBC_01465]